MKIKLNEREKIFLPSDVSKLHWLKNGFPRRVCLWSNHIYGCLLTIGPKSLAGKHVSSWVKELNHSIYSFLPTIEYFVLEDWWPVLEVFVSQLHRPLAGVLFHSTLDAHRSRLKCRSCSLLLDILLGMRWIIASKCLFLLIDGEMSLKRPAKM